MKLLPAWVLVAVAGCTSPNPTKHCSDGMCLNPDFPYCDVEGVVSGEPETCIAVTCTPGEIRTCLGDDAFTCTPTGDGYERLPCDLGCSDSPKPHCKYIEPRYVPDACEMRAVDEQFVVKKAAMLDPNLDSNCSGGIVPQQGAPPICVVRYRDIVIEAGGILKVTGSPNTVVADTVGRPVMFVADNDVVIDGVLDISADGIVNGPGGGLIVSGGPVKLVMGGIHDGGGGAGGKRSGAAGGGASDGAGGAGGLPVADPALLGVFFGGAAANRPASGTEHFTRGGGGGGGAAALVACTGRISIAGTVDAGGGGGSGGGDFLGAPLPGYGGGAGGYVVLQAKLVEVTGGIYANGGGGGTGRANEAALGIDGRDGTRSATSGAPGYQGQNGGGNAGVGGAQWQLPGVGGMPTASLAQAGGGGGSVGFLQTYTPEGFEPVITSDKVSPTFQPNIVSKTR